MKAFSSLNTLTHDLGPKRHPVSTQPLTDHGRLLAEIAQLPHLHHLQLDNLAAAAGGPFRWHSSFVPAVKPEGSVQYLASRDKLKIENLLKILSDLYAEQQAFLGGIATF